MHSDIGSNYFADFSDDEIVKYKDRCWKNGGKNEDGITGLFYVSGLLVAGGAVVNVLTYGLGLLNAIFLAYGLTACYFWHQSDKEKKFWQEEYNKVRIEIANRGM